MKCEVVKEGNFVTMISYGAQFHVAEEAAKEFEENNPGVTVELIDL